MAAWGATWGGEEKVSWRVWTEMGNDTAEKPRKTEKTGSIVPFLGCFMERHFFFGLKHEIVKISLLHLPYFIHFAER